ncbi:hypothetical protein J6590_018388 [Homalodisca vitripennis]|nr:hypothetical protein J6590_018388 [Homalodisca vitripennis]
MVRIRQDIARQIIKVLNAAMNKPESLENKRPRVKERYYSHKTSKACSRWDLNVRLHPSTVWYNFSSPSLKCLFCIIPCQCICLLDINRIVHAPQRSSLGITHTSAHLGAVRGWWGGGRIDHSSQASSLYLSTFFFIGFLVQHGYWLSVSEACYLRKNFISVRLKALISVITLHSGYHCEVARVYAGLTCGAHSKALISVITLHSGYHCEVARVYAGLTCGAHSKALISVITLHSGYHCEVTRVYAGLTCGTHSKALISVITLHSGYHCEVARVYAGLTCGTHSKALISVITLHSGYHCEVTRVYAGLTCGTHRINVWGSQVISITGVPFPGL